MATSREFADYVLGQCAGLNVRCRAMMGEYLFYYREKLAGGLYDGCMLVKDVPAARAMLPDAQPTPPYPGAKGMLIVDQLEDRQFLARLLEAMYPQLPAPRERRAKGT